MTRIVLRIYRVLLGAMPASFRDRYGSEAYALAAERLHEATGFAVVRLATREIVDLVQTIWQAHRARVVWSPPDIGRTSGTAVATAGRAARSLFRGFRHSPGFALGVIAILVLGLGINAVTFGLASRVFITGPAGLSAPEQLRRLIVHGRDANGNTSTATSVSYADYLDLREARTLAGVAAETGSRLVFGEGESAEPVTVRLVTANYFGLLGARPEAGRFFTEEESARRGEALVVLSDRFWRRRFGGRSDALGQTVRVGEGRYTIVGVTPVDFTGTSMSRVDMFLPLEAASAEEVSGNWRTNRGFTWINLVLRLAPHASVRESEAEASVMLNAARAATRAGSTGATLQAELQSIGSASGDGGELQVAFLIVVLATLVLAIALANLAHLFLARSLRRREATSVRLALGATRWRIAAEDALEGSLLAGCGALLAVGAAGWSGPVLPALLFPDIDWLGRGPNWPAMSVLVVLAVVAGAVCAGVPAWQASNPHVTSLSAGGRRSSPRCTRTQAGLLVFQSALSIVLVVGAALFVKSLSRASSVDLGLDVDRVHIVRVLGADLQAGSPFLTELRVRASRTPGVESTSLVGGTVPFVASRSTWFAVDGLPERPRIEDGGPYIHAVTPEYFQTSGTIVVEGRSLAETDRRGAPLVVVVNRTMARLYWPGESALGKCLRIGQGNPPCARVVGIAENTRRQDVIEGDSLLYYVPLDQAPADMGPLDLQLLVRTSEAGRDASMRLANAIRHEAYAMAPNLRFVAVRSLDDVLSPQLRVWRLGAVLFSLFGLLALAVAGAGLYSVVAFDVEGRRYEVGVRFALGASPSRVFGVVIARGLRLALAGIVTGLGAAWLLAPMTADLLYATSAHEWTAFLAAPVVLAIVVLLATLVPAWRAGRIDPVAALRDPR